MPSLTAIVADWAVAEGAKGEPTVELETSKSSFEVEAERDGALIKMAVAQGGLVDTSLTRGVASVFLKSTSGATRHRQHKRKLEISMAIDAISSLVVNDYDIKSRHSAILEFGSGIGFQTAYLQQLGSVVASDIYTSDTIRQLDGVSFVQCRIAATPFKEGRFDVIAMASGLVVIAIRVGGVPSVIEDGVTGLLLGPRSPEGIASAIERVISDPELRKWLAQNALKAATRDTIEDQTRAIGERGET